MSSGTRWQPQAFKRMAPELMRALNDKVARLGMSPRQQELNRRLAIYSCSQYEARTVDWDGGKRPDPIERESVATAGFIPPGFYSPQMQDLPLSYRRPTAPYHLVKCVVDRFTGLLFSERRHPKIHVAGDPQTEDYAQALAEAARLWPAMIQARTLGGATGSVAVGFQFREGRPVVEVHDPRWVFPDFEDRQTQKLLGIEKRYMYPVEVQDQETGAWETEWYWYRRIIDRRSDVLFAPAPVDDGSEPNWVEQERVEHGLGFCPVLWVQNLPVLDDIDGEPDAHGIYDLVEAIDSLLSQANKAVVLNCDPTLSIVSTDELPPQLKKGSFNAIKLTQGNMNYLEISGTGPGAAREMAKEFRGYALEVAQCVLDHPDVAGRTATEIERVYSAMSSKADVLREQYGERCIKPLLGMMLEAARRLSQKRPLDGALTSFAVDLPQRADPDGRRVPRQLGPGGDLELRWPGYFDPGLPDAQAAAQAAGAALATGLIDREHAVSFVAPFFGVEDARAVVEKIAEERRADGARLDSDLLSPTDGEGAGRQEAEKVTFFQYEIEGGIVTINEVRASKGLPPINDGDLTLPEYRAKHRETFAAATVVESAGSAEKILGMDQPAEEGAPAPGTPGPGRPVAGLRPAGSSIGEATNLIDASGSGGSMGSMRGDEEEGTVRDEPDTLLD